MGSPRFTDSRTFLAHVRAALDDADDADWRVVADKILADLTADEHAVALAVTLPRYVQDIAHNDARNLRTSLDPDETIAPATPNHPPSRRSTSGPSIADRVRADWRAKLDATRIYTGNVHRFFRDCTPTDLFSAAQLRRKIAVANQSQAAQLTRVAEWMTSHGYATVADIPDDELRKALGVTE